MGENNNSTVLLIGGAGYEGSVVTQHLLESGYSVRCLDLLLYQNEAAAESFIGHPNYEFIFGDLCDQLVDDGTKVIYRPHPSDAPIKLENMEVDGRWSIAPWLHSCSLLINANCATSFDAYVSGTPSIAPKGSSREYAFRFANAFARKIKND